MANQTRRSLLRGILSVPASTVLASGSAGAQSVHNGINMQAYNALRLVNTAELWFKLKVGKYGNEEELNRSPILPRCIQVFEKSSGVELPPGLGNLADAATGLDLRIQTKLGAEGYLAWINDTHRNGNLYLATDESGVIYRGLLINNVDNVGGRQFNSLQDFLKDLTPALQRRSRSSFSEMLGQFAYSIMAVQYSCDYCCFGQVRCCCLNGLSACCGIYNGSSCTNTGCEDTPWCCCCYLAGPEGVSDNTGHGLSQVKS